MCRTSTKLSTTTICVISEEIEKILNENCWRHRLFVRYTLVCVAALKEISSTFVCGLVAQQARPT